MVYYWLDCFHFLSKLFFLGSGIKKIISEISVNKVVEDVRLNEENTMKDIMTLKNVCHMCIWTYESPLLSINLKGRETSHQLV